MEAEDGGVNHQHVITLTSPQTSTKLDRSVLSSPWVITSLEPLEEPLKVFSVLVLEDRILLGNTL